MWEGKYAEQLKTLITLYDKRITKIENFELILGINYTEERLEKIRDLSKNKGLDGLIQMKVENEVRGESDLTVVKFNDKNGASYLAVIYDSWELWDDPMVLNIYPI